MADTKPRTRIQEKNRAAILDAALEMFSQHGFRGATLDQIAQSAGLSKPNVLYYFPSKEAIHEALLSGLLDDWLEPLRNLGPELAEGREPVDEIVAYVLRKLEMSRTMGRESRLFANEIIHGAPRMGAEISGGLRSLVEEKAAMIEGWMAEGRLAPVDPRHLIFSIWATTQHYADFDVQVRGILQPEGDAHYPGAAEFLSQLYRTLLTPAARAGEAAKALATTSTDG